jgi:hypothetical protein
MKAKADNIFLPPLPEGFAESLAPLLKEEMQDIFAVL